MTQAVERGEVIKTQKDTEKALRLLIFCLITQNLLEKVKGILYLLFYHIFLKLIILFTTGQANNHSLQSNPSPLESTTKHTFPVYPNWRGLPDAYFG